MRDNLGELEDYESGRTIAQAGEWTEEAARRLDAAAKAGRERGEYIRGRLTDLLWQAIADLADCDYEAVTSEMGVIERVTAIQARLGSLSFRLSLVSPLCCENCRSQDDLGLRAVGPHRNCIRLCPACFDEIRE
jgi:hypothetical protein